MMEYINRLKIFLNEVKIEMKKVSWPTRKETMYTTSAVIISVFLISFFLGLVDLGLSKLIERLIK
ncbi:MAG: preprotein translocase subunit SecE [Nitrospinae bacterium RIFCSPLOWO2_12_39_16]|nr:MAG: preprotein translocase subunit SecE [Nitrospinae bacterium RIFCSPLOWO2_12_39_16]